MTLISENRMIPSDFRKVKQLSSFFPSNDIG